MFYRKKPVVIEAIEWDGSTDSTEVIRLFRGVETQREFMDRGSNVFLIIETLEGEHRPSPGDFIIKGIAGEYYPCKPEIFKATYEAVEDQ